MMGICGDNCLYCPRYIATQSGNVSELEKVKDLWLRLGLGNPTLSAQDMICSGCKPENNCAYSELRACVYEKGIEDCGLCKAYPCELINAAFEKSESLHSRAALVCTREEMEILKKAFFSKQQNLEKKRNDADKENKKQ